MGKKTQRHWLISIFFLLIGLIIFLNPNFVYGNSCENFNECKQIDDDTQKNSCFANVESCLENEIGKLQKDKITLNNTISIIAGQISIQELQIQQTLTKKVQLKKEIEELIERISGLNISLDRLSSILVKRVGEQYKRTQVDPIFLLFKGNSLSNFLSEYKYIKLAKKQTLEAMHRAESQRLVYDEQKNLKEQKQQELETIEKKLEAQRATLASQKQEKENLLAITKHDESRYQQLLTATRAEQQALAVKLLFEDGKAHITYSIGGLTSRGHVGSGSQIGIMGNTGFPGCSSGAHLHLENITEGNLNISENRLEGVASNPLTTLQNRTIQWFNDSNKLIGVNVGSGENLWPLNSPIITQMFGITPYSSRYAYGFHTGLDVVDLDNRTIKAIKEGELYTGTLFCNSSSSLINLAILDHGGGSFTTYLHLK